jgi:hypothetical protein
VEKYQVFSYKNISSSVEASQAYSALDVDIISTSNGNNNRTQQPKKSGNNAVQLIDDHKLVLGVERNLRMTLV